ncbi:MAG: phosphomannomutase, partial [Marinobacter sp.]|nr:phosphomannomutase [Marinobacter sp.]
LIDARIAAYPASGEINRTVENPARLIETIEKIYGNDAVSVGHVDGLSVEFERWRFNLRMSNTEPVVRLNVESRGDIPLMKEKTMELLDAMAQISSGQ